MSLTNAQTKELLQQVKESKTRPRALRLLLKDYENRIEHLCRSTSWAQQWGYEDSYQQAVTYFCERAIAAEDPSELAKYWDIRTAVSEGAAENIYQISLSPYLVKRHGYNATLFDSDLEVADVKSPPQIFDELGWKRLERTCRDILQKRDLQILNLFMQTPGHIPTAAEVASNLKLKLATAQRYIRHFHQSMRDIPELQELFQALKGIPVVASPELDSQPLITKAESGKVIRLANWKRPKLSPRPHNSTSVCCPKVIPLFSKPQVEIVEVQGVAIEASRVEKDLIEAVFVDRAERTKNKRSERLNKVLQAREEVDRKRLKVLPNIGYRGSPLEPSSGVFLELVS